MKRIGLLLASVVLLLAGCAKEQFNQTNIEEGLQTVTFTAAVEDGVTTKAVADGDGAAANVNRCIMEVYYDGNLFTRLYSPVNAQKQASFTAQLVSNRTYKVAFWADHVADAATESGLATDLYYNTASLTEVSIIDSYIGNDDARDAFAFSKEYTINQGGSSFTAILSRPFAQINVITTDVATVKKVESLVPQKVNVTLKGAFTSYNVLDSTAVAGQTSNLSYTDSLYKWDTTKSECTLSMDYIFAEKEKAVMDIDWAAIHGSDANVEHTFASVPYQRNYRTNIKGALLTTTGQWNVEIDSIWEAPDQKHDVVNDIKSLNELLASTSVTGATTLDIETTMPNDSDSQNVSFTSNNNGQSIKLTFSGELGTGKTLTLQPSGTGANGPDIVDITAPAGTNITSSLENTHFIINGVSYGTISGSFSAHSLIISKGVEVENVSIAQGGLEIHGTVGAVEIPTQHGNIYVRDCEGLSQTVYTVLEPYVDADNGYVGELEEGKSTYRIYQGLTQVAKIGEKVYYSLQKALDNVSDGQTIELLADLTQATGVNFNKNITATLDLKGYTFKVTKDTQNNARAIKTVAGTLTVKNGTIDARNVDAQGNPSPITSGDDVDIYGGTRSENGSVLNLKDLTIYSNHYNELSLKYRPGSTGEVDNCVLYCDYGGGVEAAGTVNVINSTIHQTNMSPVKDYVASGIGMCFNGVANVKDCTIDATFAAFTSMTTGGTINVDGGTYSVNNANGYAAYCFGSDVSGCDNYINLKAGIFTGKLEIFPGDHFENSAHIEVSGGYYSVDPTSFLKSGFKATALGTTPETWFVDENGGAKIGNTIYNTFKDALSAAQNGDTITLLNDFTINSAIRITGKTLTIDWSNYTMKMTGTSGGAANPMVFSGCNITMKGNKGGIVGYGEARPESIFSFDGQTNYLTIDGGHYSNTYGDVKSSDAKPSLINVVSYSDTYITINGGTLEMVCTAETLDKIQGNHSIIYSMPLNGPKAAIIKITGGNFITRLPNYTGNASDIAGKVFNLWLYGASKLDITGGTFECPGTCVRTHYANFPENCFKIDGENVLFKNAYYGLWFQQSKYNSGAIPLAAFKVRDCEYGLRTSGIQSVVVNGANISDCTYGAYNYSGSTITIQGTSSITGTSYGFKHEGNGTATLKKGCVTGTVEGEVTYID